VNAVALIISRRAGVLLLMLVRVKVELAGISKIYGSRRALHGLRLELQPGRVVALLGLNGAGKSTLLHCLAGLLGLSEGDIYYDVEVFARDRVDLRRRFGFLPDFPIFFTEMTVLQHIAMALRLYEKEHADAEERIFDLLQSFDLISVAQQPMGLLSRGQAYKVALSALIAVEPELWLLDEPMASGMDALGLTEFRRRARAAAEQGATIIYTTQILSVAEQFSDEVIVLHEGRVHAHGPVGSLSAAGELEELFASLRDAS
jgi:ABC-type multidrug transport system ATPase subunit